MQLHKKNIVLLLALATILRFMTDNAELEKLAEDYLDLWQENIRLWSVEKELLPLSDLLMLVSPRAPMQDSLDGNGGDGDE